MRSIVLNDYIHVDRRDRYIVSFEPIQPLADPNSIVGWIKSDDLTIEFNVINYNLRDLLGYHLGFIDQSNIIQITLAELYPEDIYLCISYELVDDVDKTLNEHIPMNWAVEGF